MIGTISASMGKKIIIPNYEELIGSVVGKVKWEKGRKSCQMDAIACAKLLVRDRVWRKLGTERRLGGLEQRRWWEDNAR